MTKETTTLEENLKSRNVVLEALLERIDTYLDHNPAIQSSSVAHVEIKLTLGKLNWGE